MVPHIVRMQFSRQLASVALVDVFLGRGQQLLGRGWELTTILRQKAQETFSLVLFAEERNSQ